MSENTNGKKDMDAETFRLLVVSDIHGYPGAYYLLDEWAREERVDAVLCAGDITTFGPPRYARRLGEHLVDSGFPFYTVLGNCDPPEVSHAVEEAGGEVLDMKKHALRKKKDEEHPLFLGGVNWHTLVSRRREEEFVSYISDLDVLVSHAPPKGILDRAFSGVHAGDSFLADSLEKVAMKREGGSSAKAGPVFVVSGHIHEDPGIVEKRSIVYANPGPLRERKALLAIFHRTCGKSAGETLNEDRRDRRDMMDGSDIVDGSMVDGSSMGERWRVEVFLLKKS